MIMLYLHGGQYWAVSNFNNHPSSRFNVQSAVNKLSVEKPTGKVDVQSLMDTVLDFIHDLGKGVIGEKRLDHFYMFFSDCFLFIWFSNLTGLVPGFLPATDSFSTNLY